MTNRGSSPETSTTDHYSGKGFKIPPRPQYTQGPWAYREPGYDSFEGLKKSQESDPKNIRIEQISIYVAHGPSKGSEVCRIVHDPDDGFDLIKDKDEHEANARLIAASPSLYALAASKARAGDLDAKSTLDALNMSY